MVRSRRRRTALVAVGAMVAAGLAAIPVTQVHAQEDVWTDRFLEQYDNLKTSGYFSPEGIPYHAIETLIVEAPDHGHETTSEAFSFWLWLEASYGRVTGNWQPFNQAWQTMEQWIIPTQNIQPTNANYNPGDPASYAPEFNSPTQYPSPLNFDVSVGQDPIANELSNAYGSPNVYGMHWLMDVDNVYGFGRCGDGVDAPAMINTYQRGPEESVFETIPHPSCERFNFGGPNGYLDLFIDDSEYAQQWRYTNAPDADARAVQAAYWALTWATEQGNQGQIATNVANAAKMGDWLRYSLFDKYFKQVGNCVGPNTCPAGSGKNSAHYLLSWYYAWGGGLTANWAFRIGSSHSHQGYQNPMAAWALAGNVPALTPLSPTGASDWQNSLDRQLEFMQWLQSPQGGLAGGATNSWDGQYGQPPAGTPTFYGMFYDEDPVFHDPPSNQWFGFQVWSLQRVAEYLHVTGDSRAQTILDRWVPWAISQTQLNADGSFAVPSQMSWSGAPNTWNPANPGSNSGLSVSVTSRNQDVGVTSGLARTLLWYAAATGDTAAHDTGLALIDALYSMMGPSGVTTVETRADFDRLNDPVYVPPGFSGTMPNGDQIVPGATFDSIRSFYHDDPDWPQVQAYIDGTGPVPSFEIHRFWAQSDIALAFADYALLFGEGGTTPTPPPSPPPSPPTSPPAPPTTPPPPPPGGCAVAYSVTSDWGSGFQGGVTVTNTSGAAVNGWQLQWTFPSGQQISQLWGGVHSQAGANVTVSNESWNSTIAAGSSVSVGFLGSPGGGGAPTAFTLNGNSCTVS